jgi:hypothetical protein
MILPTKHISIERSIINLGSEVLRKMNTEETVSSLWEKSRIIKGMRTFESFTLTLDFLFTVGAVEFKLDRLRKIKC